MSEASESALTIKAVLFDHRGMETGVIGERESDCAIGLVRRVVEGGSAYEPLSDFLTFAQIQKLALQVAAGNPAATGHAKTPFALAAGFLALFAAIQSTIPGETDVRPSSASH